MNSPSKKTIVGAVIVLGLLGKLYKTFFKRNEERIVRMSAGESIFEQFKPKKK